MILQTILIFHTQLIHIVFSIGTFFGAIFLKFMLFFVYVVIAQFTCILIFVYVVAYFFIITMFEIEPFSCLKSCCRNVFLFKQRRES
jgi:hypothetical protein